MKLNVTTRQIAKADLPALKDVLDAVDLFPSAMLDDLIADYLSNPASEHLWFTTEDEGIPVSIAYCEPERMTDGTWNLLAIAVRPDRQGCGVGGQMMRYIEDLLAARGQRILLVETSSLPGFEQARMFYRKNGYREEARIRDFYQHGEDKIVFRKALTER